MVLAGDSTHWKGGSHQWTEELWERVFRAICKLRTNELLLRHLMADLDGPASSKEMNVLHVGKTTYLDGRGSW